MNGALSGGEESPISSIANAPQGATPPTTAARPPRESARILSAQPAVPEGICHPPTEALKPAPWPPQQATPQGEVSLPFGNVFSFLVGLVPPSGGAGCADRIRALSRGGEAAVEQPFLADRLSCARTKFVGGLHRERVVAKGGEAAAAGAVGGAIIEVHDLKKSYAFKPVLRRLDLVVERGQRVAVLGPNGAGKTTLLRILAGLEKPSSGSVRVAGLDLTHDAQLVRQLVGFVAHQPYLYEELSALENLLFFGSMYNVTRTRERVLELLQRVGLERRAHERVSSFSRGQIQRLAWARALLHTPPLLLLDEPETGLDQAGSALMDDLLTEQRARGGSVLFTTHQLERALRMSEQIVLLHAGRLVSQCASAHLTLEELERTYREVLN